LPLNFEAGNPREFWDDYFSKRQPSPGVVSNLTLRLHDAGKHEHVIAVIEAALVSGQSQPWMYEVLALSMEIAGRPQEDVERILLSRVDFTGGDVPSMIYSGAYLTRFGGDRQALKLYRQASDIEPTRPEPYVLGLKLAKKLPDYDAVRWAATGIVTYAWTKDHQELHREAENAVLEAREALEKQGKNDEAAALEAAMVEARKRDLILRLTWAGAGELDLIVEEPLGTVCSYENPQSRGGGVLVHDGYGPNQQNCYEEYVCAFGAPGTYRAKIRHVSGNIVGKRGQLTIIRYQGTSNESVQRIAVPIGERDQVVRIPLQHGRRTDLAPLPQALPAGAVSGSFRRPRSQLIGPPDAAGRAAARSLIDSRQRAMGGPAGGLTSGVGFQPIVTAIPEGVMLGAAAVVSADRRYVRLSVAPNFSTITDVFTFSFLGALAGN
jgi:hypothetical protein